MDDIEKRARELLAAELDRDGNHLAATSIRSGESAYGMRLQLAALRAIAVAITPPDGFVLVPLQPTREMVIRACKDHGYPGGDGRAYSRGYLSMLAARPEVSP